MSMTTVAYARRAYKSFSRSARHLSQLIASHQNLLTGWAYVSYECLADESSLTRRRVLQLVALLEAGQVLEVRRGHGRGHVNFYRLLDEETGLPVPVRAAKKVKSGADPGREKVQFPTPPAAEKVKSHSANPVEVLGNAAAKIVEAKERKEKGPVAIAPTEDKAEAQSPYWCDDCGYAAPRCEHRIRYREEVSRDADTPPLSPTPGHDPHRVLCGSPPGPGSRRHVPAEDHR